MLKQFMQVNNRTRFPVVEDGEINDMIETYWQLYESGQIGELYFSFVAKALDGVDNTNPDEEAFRERIRNIIATYNLDIATMIKNYRTDSLDARHNVLLVAHSQGNLFGNQMYALLTDKEKEKFKMVSVATPANNVTGNYSLDAPYTTIVLDYTIAAIKNSFPGNAGGFGHTFVDSYLNSGTFKTRAKINSDITNAVNLLDQNSCKKEYDYYRFMSYICPTRQDQELVVDIYGTDINGTANTLRREEYITSDVRVRVFEDTSGVGECPLTSDDYRASVSSYDKNGCRAYTFTDTSGENFFCDPQIYDICREDEYILDNVSTSTYSSIVTCSTYNMDANILSTLLQSSKFH